VAAVSKSVQTWLHCPLHERLPFGVFVFEALKRTAARVQVSGGTCVFPLYTVPWLFSVQLHACAVPCSAPDRVLLQPA
jgi:hypothetical protein